MSAPGALDGPVGQVPVQPQPAAGGPHVIGAHPYELPMNSKIYSCTPMPQY